MAAMFIWTIDQLEMLATVSMPKISAYWVQFLWEF